MQSAVFVVVVWFIEFTFLASVFCICHKSRWTELTNGSVVLHKTRRVISATCRQTGIYTLIIDAGHIRRTTIVSQAYRYRWSTVLHAHALWLVVQYLAGFVLRALCASTLILHTRIGASAIEASQVGCTFFISHTFTFIRGTNELAKLIHNKSRLANADWPVVTSFALFVAIANESRGIARVHTSPSAITAQ